MMTLAQWLEQHGMTQAAFAARLGVPQSTVSRWCRGAVPKPKHIAGISAETGGAVGPASWFEQAA